MGSQGQLGRPSGLSDGLNLASDLVWCMGAFCGSVCGQGQASGGAQFVVVGWCLCITVACAAGAGVRAFPPRLPDSSAVLPRCSGIPGAMARLVFGRVSVSRRSGASCSDSGVAVRPSRPLPGKAGASSLLAACPVLPAPPAHLALQPPAPTFDRLMVSLTHLPSAVLTRAPAPLLDTSAHRHTHTTHPHTTRPPAPPRPTPRGLLLMWFLG